jgi:hypothetical protein
MLSERRRYLTASCAILGILIVPAAVDAAHSTGKPVVTGKRHHVSKETSVVANNSGYALRFSNRRIGAGGGIVSGCRSAVGKEACMYADNLRDGLAFLFRVRQGTTGGRIEVQGTNAKPFTTNATAVADGLNADRVDGHQVECPANTVELAGACWDKAPRAAASSNAASDVCHTAGGRLPTPLALRAIRGENEIDLGSQGAGSDHITDSTHVDGATSQVIAVSDNGDMRAVAATATHPYRCVFELVRAAS